MNKKYIVELTSQERTRLREIINAKQMAAHKRRHARMLLKMDQGPDGPSWQDHQVAEAFDCTARNAERLLDVWSRPITDLLQTYYHVGPRYLFVNKLLNVI